MTVSTIRTTKRQPKGLSMTWVPVRGNDGRTRMEMRWSDATRRSERRAA